jgi:hypothetical protein
MKIYNFKTSSGQLRPARFRKRNFLRVGENVTIQWRDQKRNPSPDLRQANAQERHRRQQGQIAPSIPS